MAKQVAQKYKDELKYLKECVLNSEKFFSNNKNRFSQVRSFVYQSNLDQSTRTKLQELKKPIIENNVLSVYLSRLRGEFSTQSPSFEVAPYDDFKQPNLQVMDTIEGHLQEIKGRADKVGFSDRVYGEQLSGGFSCMKVYTDYMSPNSNDQIICLGTPHDCTMVGFDPMARDKHKGDGSWCYELVPIKKADLKRMYPNLDVDKIPFTRDGAGVSFSYATSANEKIALLTYFFKKRFKKIKIHRLSTGQDVTDVQYKALLDHWEKTGIIAQPPISVYSRMSTHEVIDRYVFVETEVLEYEETVFRKFPLIFVDGDSVYLNQEQGTGEVTQFTRPYAYPALDAQRVKNMCFQTAANEIENRVSHKFMVARAAIPEQAGYVEAWIDFQKPATLVWNHVDQNNNPIPMPQAVETPPLPPEILAMYQAMDQSIQAALGNFDPMYAEMTRSQVSGKAIVEAATQNNSAAMPFVMSFNDALTRAAEVILDIMPDVYGTRSNIPVIKKDGKRTLVPINPTESQNALPFDFTQDSYTVNVKAGVNFEIQKNRDLQVLGEMAQVYPVVAQFVNQECLPILMKNLTINGAAQLQTMAQQFQNQQKQMQIQQQQQQQQSQQNSPENNPLMQRNMIQGQKIHQDAIYDAHDLALKKYKIDKDFSLDKERVLNERLEIVNKNDIDEKQLEADMLRDHAENVHSAVDLAIKKQSADHAVAKDIVHHAHELMKDSRESLNQNREESSNETSQ